MRKTTGWALLACTAIVAVLVVPACGNDQKVATKQERKAARLSVAQTLIDKPLERRVYMVDGHQLLVIQVLSADSDGYVTEQACFIWRDAEYKTASMQCPAEQSSVDPIQTPSGYTGSSDTP